ncbi:hypothetical protein ACIBTZ_31060 [Micromonospora sp. NPDC049460]|uniref:hypothetical protein n=1 Tax=Micromonospora sp. NPDC049460 TaxID=3364272 RepID=UPI0037A18B1F
MALEVAAEGLAAAIGVQLMTAPGQDVRVLGFGGELAQHLAVRLRDGKHCHTGRRRDCLGDLVQGVQGEGDGQLADQPVAVAELDAVGAGPSSVLFSALGHRVSVVDRAVEFAGVRGRGTVSPRSRRLSMSRRKVPYGSMFDQNSAVRPRRSSSVSFSPRPVRRGSAEPAAC